MTFDDVMKELETMGTEQNRKVYRRHGVGENMFGVSYANLGALKKRIKRDQALAQALWASGNHDARVLATMVADPAQLGEAELETWAGDLDCYVLVDNFVGMAFRSPAARACMERWIRSDDEWIGRAGWNMLGQFAMHDPVLPDEFFTPYLHEIEVDIHTRKNRIRAAMNNTLIAIGIRSMHLEALAVAAAQRIGRVFVDHGETGCKTP